MVVRKLLIGFIAALLMGSAAHALAPHATLVVIDGTVMVNQGEQFRTAVQGMPLAAGDRVMVMTSGEAVLAFGADCEVAVAANSIVTIPEGSPCDEGVALVVQSTSSTYTQAVGAPVGESVAKSRMWWGVVGGAVVAAVVYDRVIRDSDDDDPDPISP